MSQQLISERESLMLAIDLAQQKITKAQDAQKAAERKVAALQVRMDNQYATFVFVRSRLEKAGIELDPWEDDPDGRIKLLESQYEQILVENLRLRELLSKTVEEDARELVPESTSPTVERSQPAPLDDNSPIEIDAAPAHAKRSRG